MKTYSLEELTDKYIGIKGTKKRDDFENELRFDLICWDRQLNRCDWNVT